MKKQLTPLDMAVIVFGANFLVSLLWFVGSPNLSGDLKTAYGCTIFIFLTLFIITFFIKMKNVTRKLDSD